MNKDRAQRIAFANIELENIKSKLNALLEEEQRYYDNIPENLEGSMRAETSEEYIEYMEEGLAKLQEAIDDFGEIV